MMANPQRERDRISGIRMLAMMLVLATLAILSISARAQSITVLHVFTGPPDGAEPYAALVMDTEGNLYGTTVQYGGNGNNGTVWKLTP